MIKLKCNEKCKICGYKLNKYLIISKKEIKFIYPDIKNIKKIIRVYCDNIECNYGDMNIKYNKKGIKKWIIKD